MRKFVFLLAAAALPHAYAQSSVTFSGTIDANMTFGQGSVSDVTQVDRNGNGTSRITISGIEALGNGLSAKFMLQGAFYPDNGSGVATNTNNQDSGKTPTGAFGFNRHAWVALAGNFGEIRLGRDYVPTYFVYTGAYEPFAVLGVGAAVNYTASVDKLTLIRASNAINYLSPKLLGGLQLHLSHWRGENAGGTATEDDGTGSGARATYTKGPFSGTVAWGRTEFAAGDAVNRNAAVSWDFGVAKIRAIVNQDDLGSITAKGYTLGLTAPAGPGLFKASYSGTRTDAAGKPESRKVAVGYVYDLSKRTALYGTVAHVSNKGGAKLALGGATTAANESSTGYQVGLRHNF